MGDPQPRACAFCGLPGTARPPHSPSPQRPRKRSRLTTPLRPGSPGWSPRAPEAALSPPPGICPPPPSSLSSPGQPAGRCPLSKSPAPSRAVARRSPLTQRHPALRSGGAGQEPLGPLAKWNHHLVCGGDRVQGQLRPALPPQSEDPSSCPWLSGPGGLASGSLHPVGIRGAGHQHGSPGQLSGDSQRGRGRLSCGRGAGAQSPAVSAGPGALDAHDPEAGEDSAAASWEQEGAQVPVAAGTERRQRQWQEFWTCLVGPDTEGRAAGEWGPRGPASGGSLLGNLSTWTPTAQPRPEA
ncbi:uncharacterized protein AAEQ78_026264 [Lycaon pictus]